MNRPGTPRTSGISGTTIIQHWHLWAACLCDTSSEPSILFRTISATPRRDLKHISTGNRKLTATTPRTSRTTRMSINNYHLQQHGGQRVCFFRHCVGCQNGAGISESGDTVWAERVVSPPKSGWSLFLGNARYAVCLWVKSDIAPSLRGWGSLLGFFSFGQAKEKKEENLYLVYFK